MIVDAPQLVERVLRDAVRDGIAGGERSGEDDRREHQAQHDEDGLRTTAWNVADADLEQDWLALPHPHNGSDDECEQHEQDDEDVVHRDAEEVVHPAFLSARRRATRLHLVVMSPPTTNVWPRVEDDSFIHQTRIHNWDGLSQIRPASCSCHDCCYSYRSASAIGILDACRDGMIVMTSDATNAKPPIAQDLHPRDVEDCRRRRRRTRRCSRAGTPAAARARSRSPMPSSAVNDDSITKLSATARRV